MEGERAEILGRRSISLSFALARRQGPSHAERQIGEASGCRHSACLHALGVLRRSGDLCISRTSIGQYVEAAKQQRVWAREARLAESDA